MTDNIIQLKRNENVLRFKIIDEEGNYTGNYLEFNLEDTELLTTYQKILEEDKKARAKLKNQYTIIEKKQDHKGKKLLSSNEEAKIRAVQDFYKREEEIYDMFLGENGVKKILNGRKLSWSSFDEINEIIETTIMPKLQISAENIKDKIMKKYSDKRDDVIE